MTIPLIRASQLEPFVSAASAAGLPVEVVVESAGLRPDVTLETPEALVPEYAVWDVIERCARTAGAPSFGWDVGLDTPIESIGAFGREVGAARTLREAIRLFLEAVSRHSSHARFSLVPGPEHTWLCRHGIDSIGVGSWQVEQYVLGLMVRLVRLALDDDWTPTTVLLKQPSPPPGGLPANIGAARIQFASPVTAIAIPIEALDLPIAQGASGPVALDPIDLDVAAGLRHAIGSSFGVAVTNLEHAARCAGVTPRTLQRWLAREGTTFARELQKVRRELAVRLLSDKRLSIASVARRVGYGDAANFTRAFKRWTDNTPKAYRNAAGRRGLS